MRHDLYTHLKRHLGAERPTALATVIAGPAPLGGQLLLTPGGDSHGSLGDRDLDTQALSEARRLLAEKRSEIVTLTTDGGEVEVFVEVQLPPPRLVIVGAVHTAIPLITFARTLGFHTTVVDPRGVFATAERFAQADQLIREWPDEAFRHLPLTESTAVVLLSHDPKIDLPALRVVLWKPVFYIGALGSRKTHAKRVKALEAEGFSEEEIGRIHAPVGLDLGGRRPEEIALAVIAEIVAVEHGARDRLSGKGES